MFDRPTPGYLPMAPSSILTSQYWPSRGEDVFADEFVYVSVMALIYQYLNMFSAVSM